MDDCFYLCNAICGHGLSRQRTLLYCFHQSAIEIVQLCPLSSLSNPRRKEYGKRMGHFVVGFSFGLPTQVAPLFSMMWGVFHCLHSLSFSSLLSDDITMIAANCFSCALQVELRMALLRLMAWTPSWTIARQQEEQQPNVAGAPLATGGTS